MENGSLGMCMNTNMVLKWISANSVMILWCVMVNSHLISGLLMDYAVESMCSYSYGIHHPS